MTATPHPTWLPLNDPRPLPPVKPAERAGSWTGPDGTPLTGAYTQPADGDLVDGVALRNGWCLARWRGPAFPYTHPMLSPMNIVIGNGLLWDVDAPATIRTRADQTLSAVLLAGQKPYGYFEAHNKGVVFSRRAQAAGLAVTVHHDEPGEDDGWVSISAGRRERFRDLYDLPAVAAAYQQILFERLPAARARDVFAQEAEDLLGLADVTPADFISDRNIDDLHFAATGLVLGYAPLVTAGYLIADPPLAPEQGCYPEAPPNEFGDELVDLVLLHLDQTGHTAYLAWIAERGVTFDNAHLETVPGLVHYAYRRCWRTTYETESYRYWVDRTIPWERCCVCREPNFIGATYDWMALRRMRPAGRGDDSYQWITCLNDWGLPAEFLAEHPQWAGHAAAHPGCVNCDGTD